MKALRTKIPPSRPFIYLLVVMGKRSRKKKREEQRKRFNTIRKIMPSDVLINHDFEFVKVDRPTETTRKEPISEPVVKEDTALFLGLGLLTKVIIAFSFLTVLISLQRYCAPADSIGLGIASTVLATLMQLIDSRKKGR